jgi:hypothetical protein
MKSLRNKFIQSRYGPTIQIAEPAAADELIDLWVERVQEGEPVEMPWWPLRSTVFRDGTPSEGWRRMVEKFAARGVTVTKHLRGNYEAVSVWVVLSKLD